MSKKKLDTGMQDELAKGEVLVYQTDDGRVKLDVRLEDETVWLSQPLMAELFQTTQQNISQHILNIYEEGELVEEATHKKFLSVRQEGDRQVQRSLDFYNLDMIISVGYRVKGLIATRFRIWATQRLKEYIVKGFTMDDERLKNPPLKGSLVPDYFDEMLTRIRDIRASERLFYQKVTDIYATSIDYDPQAEMTQLFFQTVQNKMHWAAHGHTAAEIVRRRADAARPNMDLTTWKNAPAGPVRRQDATIAKNQLSHLRITSRQPAHPVRRWQPPADLDGGQGQSQPAHRG
jgi:hypothetical protein